MRTLPLTLAAAVLAAGCSSAPKLSKPSGALRPANDADYIAAIKAQSDADAARRDLEIATRALQAQTALLQAHAAPRMQAAGLRATRASTPMESAAVGNNVVYTIRFALGATKPAPAADAFQALAQAAKASPFVVIRGRTDSTAFTPANDRVARLRAEETRALLINAGVEPRRIRVTWQAAGDLVASNDTASGRDLNRRAEVEVYAADPTQAPPPAAPAPGPVAVAN